MIRTQARWLAPILLAATLAPSPAEADPPTVAEILGRRIIGPDLALVEVRAFAEPRVAPMPQVATLVEWETQAARIRSEVLDKVVYRGEAARWRDLPTRVEWLGEAEGGAGYRIRKLRYEAVPGFWVPALLYEPAKLEGKVPAVLNFDGHDPLGMFADYKQARCINLARRGVLALNVDWIGMGQLRSPENAHGLLNHLDLCGTSGLAVFYGLQTRGVDVLLGLEHADPARIAATGLSGGGWQTIFLGAMDPRVKLVAPVAGYASFRTRAAFAPDLGDSEQSPTDLATITDYAPMTALLAPRAALLTFNARDDCCFVADHALPPLLDAARPIYRLYGAESKLRTHTNEDPGTHNYLKDNREALYRMIRDQFLPDAADYPLAEFPVDGEIKTPDQLRVPLPADNATLHSLALGLAKDLPRDPTLPTNLAEALAWQEARRAKLAEIVREQRFSVREDARGEETTGDVTARLLALNLGDTWTIPAVELTRGEPRATLLILADAGRKSVGPLAETALADGFRVLAIDPFDLGESTIAEKGWLWNLYLAAVGRRPLGLRASQVASIARAAAARSGHPVAIRANGPRSTLAALIAAGLEPRAIGDLELRDAPATLKDPILARTPPRQSPRPVLLRPPRNLRHPPTPRPHRPPPRHLPRPHLIRPRLPPTPQSLVQDPRPRPHPRPLTSPNPPLSQPASPLPHENPRDPREGLGIRSPPTVYLPS